MSDWSPPHENVVKAEALEARIAELEAEVERLCVGHAEEGD